ncbi:MAG: acyltransferase family protein [Cetobacterium sp.]
MRNKELDFIRGLTMIYIVGVIHTLYWSGLVQYKFKSLFLIEMIFIFFIMGASFSYSPKIFSIKYFLTRFFRCMTPFWIYNIFTFILHLFSNKIDNFDMINILKNILDPRMSYNKIPFLNWHIWFIPVYILMIPIIPEIYKIYESKKEERYSVFFVPIILGISIFLLDVFKLGNYYLRNLLFYSIFVYFGFFYKEWQTKNNIKKHYSSIFICGILLVLLYKQYGIDMQKNKFPPNFMFLIYNFFIFNILILSKRNIFKVINKIKILDKIISFYAENNFILYLWQPFTYLFIYCVKEYFGHLKVVSLLLTNSIFFCFIVICLNMINALIFSKTEKFDILKIGEKTYAKSIKKLFKINESQTLD